MPSGDDEGNGHDHGNDHNQNHNQNYPLAHPGPDLHDPAQFHRHDPDPPPALPHPSRLDVESDSAVERAWVERNQHYFLQVPFHRLQRPPLLAPLWGIGEEQWQAVIKTHYIFASRRIHRRMTAEEAELYTTHIARGTTAASLSRPLGMGATALALWRGWDAYRFPFFRWSFARWNPDAFPTGARWERRPLLRGRLANAAWHGLRVGAYGLLGYGLFEWAGLGRRWEQWWLERADSDALFCEMGLYRMMVDTMEVSERTAREGDDLED